MRIEETSTKTFFLRDKKVIPQKLFVTLVRGLCKVLFRVTVKGLENYHAAGNRTVIIANHTSFLDGVLLAAFLPDRMMFAINTVIARAWWVKPVVKFGDVFLVDSTNPISTKSLIREVQKNKRCVIFPEGRITTTGSLMKIYEGPGLVADKAGATVLPIRIDGAQISKFSRLKRKFPLRWFPQITLTILPPESFHAPEELKGRARRARISTELYDIMSDMILRTSDINKPILHSLFEAKKLFGGSHIIAEDVQFKPTNYRKLLQQCFVLGLILSRLSQNKETVGIALPNMNVTMICFFGLQLHGRIPAMINYASGAHNILSSCRAAQITKIISSRAFVEKAKLHNVIERLTASGIEIIYLEDVRPLVGTTLKLRGLLRSIFPYSAYRRSAGKVDSNTPAVVLFTSGSEGTPKGVVLSHKNIQANRFQLTARIAFSSEDIVFNALPLFHSFGLSSAAILPLVSGVKVFFYPSPLHYRIVPELIYDTQATITFGTDTFLAGYARYAHPYDCFSVRYVVAGGERLKAQTRNIWYSKLGIRILEGYGATEASPVICGNTPMHFREGTVGRFMPGIGHRIEAVEGLDSGGRLFVKGPNIMLGYLLEDKPGQIQPNSSEWYDTGDIVDIDEDGYVTLKDRAKRFAKIGGEMVSLTAVENTVSRLWPDNRHACVNLPDARKGEKIVLITEYSKAKREDLVEFVKQQGLPEIATPREVLIVNALPMLPSGKIDYIELKKRLCVSEESTC